MPTDTARTVVTTELDERECWVRLAGERIGRIAVVLRGEPAIFPVGYRVGPGGLLIRTRPGSKLLAILLDGRVALEIDRWDEDVAWSVVVSGRAEELPADLVGREVIPPASPFAGDDARAVVRITPVAVTGRELRRV
ncbi:pyridoxamine 5'-phosphate oxidase family protein [Amnibacterium kyonggiense]|uniref:Pyridoxamine 5'-phosphate oxidase-like protein n=1 Tax=Amnibacterium kyonggiense TaxID=595671 RepID=A0A4R7FKG2_9MICO|nr:pyridoxamine 5'-phosphate oxidase family protein [Amnibacterium kyonggiense]TDS76829.1 pyridoxamine 5'-phosphate oxidase-like protein [Amnibacterium kyonggiense]